MNYVSNDQYYDGFWSDFRVNLLIIKPLHNASCWTKLTLRPLWFAVHRTAARQQTHPSKLLAESKFARKNLKKQLQTKIIWVWEKKLRNYHADFLSQIYFEGRKANKTDKKLSCPQKNYAFEKLKSQRILLVECNIGNKELKIEKFSRINILKLR